MGSGPAGFQDPDEHSQWRELVPEIRELQSLGQSGGSGWKDANGNFQEVDGSMVKLGSMGCC